MTKPSQAQRPMLLSFVAKHNFGCTFICLCCHPYPGQWKIMPTKREWQWSIYSSYHTHGSGSDCNTSLWCYPPSKLQWVEAKGITDLHMEILQLLSWTQITDKWLLNFDMLFHYKGKYNLVEWCCCMNFWTQARVYSNVKSGIPCKGKR